ncbi:MAG: FAD-binding and (Fe-S)-binding domain-containing protein [Phycisphaerales bacterium]
MHLPVLPNPPPSNDTLAALERDLRGLCRGEVRFSRHDRGLYSTDASMYQVQPLGVVVPADAADARAVIAFLGERGIPMLPRGGGTSLAGQCTSEAVVIDLSPNFRHIGPVEDHAGRPSLVVGAGVPIDVLNAELARRKAALFFAPDPATTAQSVIGGNIGNNAAGARSILYGRTSENLLAVDACLASGERLWLQRSAGSFNSLARSLAVGVAAIVRQHEALIRARYPKTLRQNAGYGLDRMLAQVDAGVAPADLDLAQLVCGSEGTLAFTLSARLLLRPIPAGKGLALLAFASVDDAIAAVQPILATGPSAVELVDDVVIEAARNNRECSPFVDAFPRLHGTTRDPAAVLYVEYHAASADAVRDRFAALARAVPQGTPVRELTAAAAMADAWKLRRAGEPLLHGLPGARKPLTFVEDNAVPVERLGEFVRRFRTIVEREGTRAAFWAHASVGVLHVRPMLDPHSGADLERLKRIAVEIADLARECGGVMSGEHGDGRVRGPLLERFFGPELMGAFRDIKALFDPRGLLNPANIVGAGPIESITQRTRIDPNVAASSIAPHAPDVATFYDYSNQTDFAHALEMCNGAGVCRKVSGGTMCPSYRATLDERHSTRGRANALRLAVSGQVSTDGSTPAWTDPPTIETLDLCLSCKACKSECPSNVDVAKLKAEYTAQRYRQTGRIPLKARLVGHVRLLNRIGSLTPRLANWVNGLPPVRAALGAIMGVHPDRSLPKFSRSLFRSLPPPLGGLFGGADVPSATARPRLVLFGDCFTAYNESHIGIAAARLLTRLGYEVAAADAGCCGRSMVSVGMLDAAIGTIDATVARLRHLIDDANVQAMLFVEPSCLSAVKDDWLSLRCRTDLALRQRLAAKSWLVEEFVDRAWETHPNQALLARATSPAAATVAADQPVLLHGHCHQKALWGAESSAKALRRVLGARLQVLDTGCCGMAGSFGYDRDKFDISMRIARLPTHEGGLMPYVDDAPDATVCAHGTSCRHQIKDATGGTRTALHPIELLERLIR